MIAARADSELMHDVEQFLFRDMNIDAAGQILRRIAVVRPAP